MTLEGAANDAAIKVFTALSTVPHESSIPLDQRAQWDVIKARIATWDDLNEQERFVLRRDFRALTEDVTSSATTAFFLFPGGNLVVAEGVVRFGGGAIWRIEDRSTVSLVGLAGLPRDAKTEKAISELIDALMDADSDEERARTVDRIRVASAKGDCPTSMLEVNGTQIFLTCDVSPEAIGAELAALWPRLDSEAAKRIGWVLRFLKAFRSGDAKTDATGMKKPVEIVLLAPYFSLDSLPPVHTTTFTLRVDDYSWETFSPPPGDVFKQYTGLERCQEPDLDHSFRELLRRML